VKKSLLLLLLLCVVFASISAYAVNMPTGPIYTTTPSISRSVIERAYNKTISDYKKHSRSSNDFSSFYAGMKGKAYCMTRNEYNAGIGKLHEILDKSLEEDLYDIDAFHRLDQAKVEYTKIAYSNCMNYFTTAQNPDCTRLVEMAYIMMNSRDYHKYVDEVKASARLKAVCGNSHDYNWLF
jgi:hypothetical protein